MSFNSRKSDSRMDIEIPDQRLVDLEQALDELLDKETRLQFHQVTRRRLRLQPEAPEIHISRVMKAVYSEAAHHGDLAAPLAGALTFYELRALTQLGEEDLSRALDAVVGDRLRTRFDAVAERRIYFLPALQRGLLRKALNQMPSPVPCRLPRRVA